MFSVLFSRASENCKACRTSLRSLTIDCLPPLPTLKSLNAFFESHGPSFPPTPHCLLRCPVSEAPLKSCLQPDTWQHLLLDILLCPLCRCLGNLALHLTIFFFNLGHYSFNYDSEWANSGRRFVPKAVSLSLLAPRFLPLSHILIIPQEP